MDKKKLRKIHKEIAKLRAGLANIKSGDLMSVARQLGRVRSKQRTNEPTFISELLPHSRPISIPDHSGTLKPRTSGNILDALEQDLFFLEEELD